MRRKDEVLQLNYRTWLKQIHHNELDEVSSKTIYLAQLNKFKIGFEALARKN